MANFRLDFKTLEKAVNIVRQEFYDIGIFTKKIYNVDVNMLMGIRGVLYALLADKVFSPVVMGYYLESINIPEFCYTRCSIRDVLRHEYGHAFADLHPMPFKRRFFSDAFGGVYDAVKSEMQSPERCVSNYATTNIMEDFAETFMLYVKYKGIIPTRFKENYYIKMKWKSVSGVISLLKKYK